MTVSITQSPPRGRLGAALAAPLALGLLALTAGCPASTGDSPDAGMVTASFTSLYGDYFGRCSRCHAPGGTGRTTDTEQTLDFSSRATALASIKSGSASGLVGNFAACNGVPFVAAGMPGKSLIVAALDQPTRQVIDLSPAHATCDVDTIGDMTVKVGSAPSAAFVDALKTWVTNGAMDN